MFPRYAPEPSGPRGSLVCPEAQGWGRVLRGLVSPVPGRVSALSRSKCTSLLLVKEVGVPLCLYSPWWDPRPKLPVPSGSEDPGLWSGPSSGGGGLLRLSLVKSPVLPGDLTLPTVSELQRGHRRCHLFGVVTTDLCASSPHDRGQPRW